MNNLVIKANNIIESIMDMSKNEYKLTLFLISKINRNDKEFTTQSIIVKEFADLIGCTHNIHEYMKNIAESILAQKIKIVYGAKNMLNINWFSHTTYEANKGILEFVFNNNLAPFLLNIDMAYTKYFLDNIRFMKSKHSIKIYELLKQYEKLGSRVIELEELRIFLGIDVNEYKLYADLKKKTILKAQQDFKEYADIIFTFEEIKEVRKVSAIKFIIKKNKNNKNGTDHLIFENHININYE